MRVACASAPGSPVVSITVGAPCPAVQSWTASSSSPSPPHATFSAPTLSARSRRAGTGSVAMTLAPAAVAASAVASPMGPAPRTTACWPSGMPARPRACTAIDMGSTKAAGSGPRSPTPKTWDTGTDSSCWSPPSRWIPTRSSDTHAFARPARHG